MGTWPIYKKHFLQLILTKKTFHLIKYLLATLFFSFLFNLYLYIYNTGKLGFVSYITVQSFGVHK